MFLNPDTKFAPTYRLLDSWRGLAALVVVFHHVSGHEIGHWAVLLFFVISGYCIAAASFKCQESGMGFRAFFLRRVRRIYPPYLLSVLYFVLTRFAKEYFKHENSLGRFTLAQWVQNFTLTQWLSLLPHPRAFAADNGTNFVAAYWSLNYEEQFYLIMTGLLLLSCGSESKLIRHLKWLTCVGLAWFALFGKVSFGFFLDYWALFALGVFVFVRLCRSDERTSRSLDWVLLLSFVLSIVGAFIFDLPGERPRFAEYAVASGFALVLVWMRPLDTRLSVSSLAKAFGTVGLISYSLYLIHQCNLFVAHSLAVKIVPRAFPRPFLLLFEILIHLLIATGFWFLCERPFLNKKPVKSPQPPLLVARTA
jgi:peptidoglycan/LPS O-acetylase OafA/YrhL